MAAEQGRRSSATGRPSSAVPPPPPPALTTKVFGRRWLILAIFCLLSMSSAFQWIQYAIVISKVKKLYDVGDLAVDWTSMIYMLTYVPFVFPATWLLDKYGLRLSALLGSFGTCLGAWIKCASASPERFAVTFLGQAIVGSSQVFILGIPPRLAAVWFGPNEVSKATSIGVFGNQVGIALGFYVPTAIIKSNSVIGIAEDFQKLFLATAALTSLVFLLIFFFFTDSPPVPPNPAQLSSIATGIERNYIHSLLRLVKNRNYVLLIITYGLNVGVFYGVSTLLEQTLSKTYKGEEEFIGTIGSSLVLAGLFGSVVGGFILDKTHRFKLTTFTFYAFSTIGLIVYSLSVYYEVDLWVVLATAAFLGFFMTGYLPVGFEFGAELTFPCSEGTQSGMLNAAAQVFGIILVLTMGEVLRLVSPLASNITMTFVLLIGLVLTGLIKPDLRRQRATMEMAKITNDPNLMSETTNAELNVFITQSGTEDTLLATDDEFLKNVRQSQQRRKSDLDGVSEPLVTQHSEVQRF